MSKKYYAIKIGKNTKDKIVTSWEECSKIVLGFNSVYKSFKSEEEARAYLGAIKDTKRGQEKISKAMEYNKAKKKSTISISHLFKGTRIDREVAEMMEDKLRSMQLDKERFLNELIREWVE